MASQSKVQSTESLAGGKLIGSEKGSSVLAGLEVARIYCRYAYFKG